MAQKRRRYRGGKANNRTRSRGSGNQERKIQLIRHGVVFVLFLCIAVFGFMIVQGLYGQNESAAKSTPKEAATASKAAEETSQADNQEANQDANQDGVAASETVAPTATPSVPAAADTTITISAAGDCTLGSDKDFEVSDNFDTMYTNTSNTYFFRNVKDIFAQDDLTIVNLEGPLTTSEEEQDKEFAFKGKPEYVEILKEGSVEAVNVANNHSYDYGQQGFDDTITNLNSAGILSFGYDSTVVKEINGAKVGLIGIYTLADDMERAAQLKEKLAEVKEQGAVLTIVSFHWGIESDNYPDQVQKDLAHMAIDEGADLVLGHHPHVLQGIEKYKGKNIVYSLGNFCFGGNTNPSDKDTMIFQQTFTIQGGKVAEDDNINIIPCFVSSENWYNNYQPTPAEGSEKTRIEEKIKKFSEGLGVSDE